MFRCCTGGSSSSRPPPTSESVVGNEEPYKVTDYLYELHTPKPPTAKSVQVVFFHGLQPGDYSDAHVQTWRSENGSCIWPKTWLVDAVPGAHVFSVSYNRNSDMYIITENLLFDLLQKNIGQDDYCPVILVGHSIGGLVIKDLCNRAHAMLNRNPGTQTTKLEKFLKNMKGIFYYATPHHGCTITEQLEKMLPPLLLKYFRVLSQDTQRLNHEFDNLDRVRNKWRQAGLGEGSTTNLGRSNFLVVPEASARAGEDFNIAEGADHFSICRPKGITSRSFSKLKDFVQGIASDMLEEATSRPDNFQSVPKTLLGLDNQVLAIKAMLDSQKTLGLVGMGGLGKSTLAKEVFNKLAPEFEYSCFVPNVKLIVGPIEKVIQRIEETMHCRGKQVEKAQWRRKPMLLVLDDVSDERDGKTLLELEGTIATESRILFTSRNQRLFEYSGKVYVVDFLSNASAEQLFLSYAFPKPEVPTTQFKKVIFDIVQKCAGLPLALEVLGHSLRGRNYRFWNETRQALGRAEVIPDVDERLWEKLKLSYDGLDETLQQIFLDATTFFSACYYLDLSTVRQATWSNVNLWGPWTLREAKAAWRVAYTTNAEILWQKLVSMSLVYDADEDKPIQMHEQLQSMGRRIASSKSTNNNKRRREWDSDESLKLLRNTEELHEQDLFALRLGPVYITGTYYTFKKIHIGRTALPSLKKLRYLEVGYGVFFDGTEDCLPVETELVVLQCHEPKISQVLIHSGLRDHLVILNMSWEKRCLPACLCSFSSLTFFALHSCYHLESLPDEIGKLLKLEFLELVNCVNLKTLPESFGNLPMLNHLSFVRCHELQTLPESFGNLSMLRNLKFEWCEQLQTLPESFGNLSMLRNLKFESCKQLQTLPESFGNLSMLRNLVFYNCWNLKTLPKSFGNLSMLNHLSLVCCRQLQTLSESFGNLSALNSLKLVLLEQLKMPESFRNLPALKRLEIYYSKDRQTLPKSFVKLFRLDVPAFDPCVKLEIQPESLGNLSSLIYLEIADCGEATKLWEVQKSRRTVLTLLKSSTVENSVRH